MLKNSSFGSSSSLDESTPSNALTADETTTSPGSLLQFALIDPTTNEVVVGYENLTSGDTINLDDLDTRQYSIEVRVNPNHAAASQVASVKFATRSGQQIENIKPFALFGDRNGDYRGQTLETGINQITATAYRADGAQGEPLASLDLSYLVIDTSEESGNTSEAPSHEPDPGAGLTLAVNDGNAQQIDGTADDDTLSIRTHTGTGTTTAAGDGNDTVILYGSEAIPEGNYHEMLGDLQDHPEATAQAYFGATHAVDLGADDKADTLSLISEIGARPKFMLKHTKADGRINGAGVAGENNAAYDHWAGVFGAVEIKNFDPHRDRLKLAGHTTVLGESFTQDGDFFQTVYSEQNANNQSGPRAGAAHDDTFLGLLKFEGGAAAADEMAEAIAVDGMRTFVIKGLGKDIYEEDPTANQVGDTITDERLIDIALINAETNEVVPGYEQLTAGAEVDLSGLDLEQFTLAAQINPDHFYASEVESVRFQSNLGNQTENLLPYALFGDQQGDYNGQAIDLGEVSLKATAFSKNGGNGKAIAATDLDFSFVDNADSEASMVQNNVDALTGMASSGPLIGDLEAPDSLTNGALDEFTMGNEPTTLDYSLETMDGSYASVVMTDSVGTGDTGDEMDDLDPLSDDLAKYSNITSGDSFTPNSDRALVSAAM